MALILSGLYAFHPLTGHHAFKKMIEPTVCHLSKLFRSTMENANGIRTALRLVSRFG